MDLKFFRALIGLGLAFGVALSYPVQVRSDPTPSTTALGAVVPEQGINGEACPTRVNKWKLRSGSTIAFNLGAHQTRTLTASLEMQTDAGWFTVAIPATTLVAHTAHWHTKEVSWAATEITSAPLYFRLPVGSSKLLRLWVTGAQVLTPGDPWYAVGPVVCAPYVGALSNLVPKIRSSPYHNPDPAVLENPDHSLAAAIPSGAPMIVAQRTPAPIYSCVHPFALARVIHEARAYYPRSAIGLSGFFKSGIDVTILPSGALGAKHVALPSGVRAMDDAAIDAAKRSRYAPAVAFCEPTYGRYLFVVDFHGVSRF